MSNLIIKNGLIFDPLNEISGEIKDILIENGKIVNQFSSEDDIKEIDASNKTVIPAALDIHTHITSPHLNWVRLLGNKIESFKKTWNNFDLFEISKNYIKNGYTFICESNVLPSLSKQTLFDFNNIPVLDTSYLLNLSNIWALEGEFQKKKIESGAAFISDLLLKTKAFGLKAYNPFEAENWNFNYLREDIKTKGKLYDFTPLDVYEYLIEVNEYLKLPHSLHAHIEGYESDYGNKNLELLLERIKELELNDNLSKLNRNQKLHIAHANSYYIDGNNSYLIKFYNQNQNYDLDLGFIGFDEINPVITSDRRLITKLQKNNPNNYRIFTTATEFEGDSFITFRNFSKTNKTHLNLWANALELALEINNKWQIQFSLNFPNYGNLTNIPHISSLLFSKKARDDEISSFKKDFDHNLNSNDKNLTFNDYIIITRASPAKSLGISYIKGNLGVNADADINILNIDMRNIDPNKEFKKIENALDNIEFVIKDGKIVKKQNKYELNFKGKTFYTEAAFQEEEKTTHLKKKKEFYQKYYSIFYESLRSTQKAENFIH
ncbi:MAG: amidohydrolase family protein [Candidatus Lokiarchaeota archaeon]